MENKAFGFPASLAKRKKKKQPQNVMQNKRDQCVAASTLKIFLNFYLILDKKGFIFAHIQIPSYSYLKFCDYVL